MKPLVGAALLLVPPSAVALNYEVYPGSAYYLDQMFDRDAWSFVADHSNGLYHHPVGFHELDDAQRQLYTSHFTNRFAMVEGDMGSGSTTGDVASLQRMHALGLTPVANDRRFNYLVSPNESYNEALLADTMFTVRDLEDNGHEPDVYGVVLYGLRPVDLTPEKVTVNGEDRAATTITGLAYYLIKHRDGEPGTIDLSATRNSTTHGAGITSPVLSNPAQSIALPAGPSIWQLNIANTSGWLDYAGVLRARAAGPGKDDWLIEFTADGSDATAGILSERGRKFLQHERWMPGTTRTVTMTATPLVPEPRAFQLLVEALPHGMIDHALDILAFTHGTVANTPPTLAFEARPRSTRENLPLGPVWFTCGDAETPSTALTVTATSSNTTLVPAANLQLGQNGIQQWLRVVPAPGQWGESTITLTASDGQASASTSFTLAVERTTVLPVNKANNTIDLETPASWTTSTTPGETDQAVWDATVTAANATVVTSPLAVAGLRVTNPGGDVSIHADAPLSLGVAGIDLSTAIRDLMISGSVEANEFATWNIATGRTVRLANGVAGLGGVTKSGGGRLEILGPHMFAGPLTASAGEIVTTGAGSQSATTVSGNAVFRAAHSSAFGNGGLNISAANNSTGRVDISGGIHVLAGRSVTINARNSNTDAIVSNGENTFAGNISLSTGGSIYGIHSASETLHLSGNVSSIASGTRNFTLRGPAAGRLTGTISNGSGTVGIIKAGTGSWTLAGTHTFTGPVAVNDGVLVVNQPLPEQSISVEVPATLEGTATLGGTVTVMGSYSPGDGAASQTITGDLSFLTGSQFRCDIQSENVADRLNATTVTLGENVGLSIAADLAGGMVDFSSPAWSQPLQWTIIEAESLTGNLVIGGVSRDSGGRPAAPFGTFQVATTTTAATLHWTPGEEWTRWLFTWFGESWNDPAIAAPEADPDGDGWSNRDEWITGTFPQVEARRVRLFIREQHQPDILTAPRILLSEFEVLEGTTNHARGRTVRTSDAVASRPHDGRRVWSAAGLTDGHSSTGRLMPIRPWIEQLAKRFDLETDHRALRAQRAQILSHTRAAALTTAFASLAAVIIGLIIWQIRIRLAARRHIHSLRRRIAGDFHDEVGSNLATISLLSEIHSSQPNSGSAADISRLARESSLSLREIIDFTLVPKRVRKPLPEHLREIADVMLRGITWKITDSGSFELDLENRRNLVFFFKEALHNIIRHAEASHVELHLEADGQRPARRCHPPRPRPARHPWRRRHPATPQGIPRGQNPCAHRL